MTFAITIDFPNWVTHQTKVLEKFGGNSCFVPVVKSNGYGLGQANLARMSAFHAVPRIAVGTIFEVESVSADFVGEIVVLEPINPSDLTAWNLWEQYRTAAVQLNLIQTVADSAVLATLSDLQSRFPILLEARTSLNRFGFFPAELKTAYEFAQSKLNVLGFTAHFPPNTELAVAVATLGELPVTESPIEFSVSHLSATDFSKLKSQFPNLLMRIRVGTEFWLGNRNLLQATGKVLEIHNTVGSVRVGYHQQKTTSAFAVVSGGTAHGVSLSAPRAGVGLRQKLAAVYEGLLQALGRNRSPFSLNGKKLWFIEPPHQHVSILRLPNGHGLTVGSELPAEVRFTISQADEVRGITG